MTRRAAQIWLGGVAAATAGLLLATPAAVAASGSRVTATDTATNRSVAGQTVMTDTTIRVTGSGSQPGRQYTLDVVEPDGTSYRQDSATAGFRPAHPHIDLPTTNQPNGQWTADLTGGGQTDFTLAVPPAQVSGLSATAAGGGITLRWTANAEPDIVGYTVRSPSGAIRTYSPSQAGCATGTACAAGYRPTSAEAGRTLHFTVVAERNGACGCAANPLSGPPSGTAVRAPAATPGANGSRATAGSPGAGSSFPGAGSGSSGDAVGPGGFTSGGRLQAFVPGTGGTLPGPRSGAAGSGAVLPGGEGPGATQDQGGYEPTLAYPGHREPGSAAGGPTGTGESLAAAFAGPTTWRSLGLAAVLLLAATHLLLWLRRAPVEL